MPPTYRDWMANSTNPCNVQTRSTGPWLGQVGTAPDQRAIFVGPIFGVLAAREVLLEYAKLHDPAGDGASLSALAARWTGRPAKDITSYTAMIRLLVGGRSGDPVHILASLPKLLLGIIAAEHTFTGPAEMVVDAAIQLAPTTTEDK